MITLEIETNHRLFIQPCRYIRSWHVSNGVLQYIYWYYVAERRWWHIRAAGCCAWVIYEKQSWDLVNGAKLTCYIYGATEGAMSSVKSVRGAVPLILTKHHHRWQDLPNCPKKHRGCIAGTKELLPCQTDSSQNSRSTLHHTISSISK